MEAVKVPMSVQGRTSLSKMPTAAVFASILQYILLHIVAVVILRRMQSGRRNMPTTRRLPAATTEHLEHLMRSRAEVRINEHEAPWIDCVHIGCIYFGNDDRRRWPHVQKFLTGDSIRYYSLWDGKWQAVEIRPGGRVARASLCAGCDGPWQEMVDVTDLLSEE